MKKNIQNLLMIKNFIPTLFGLILVTCLFLVGFSNNAWAQSSNKGIYLYPAFFEIETKNDKQILTYTVENASENTFTFIPDIIKFSQNEDLSYSFSTDVDSNVKSQFKFDSPKYTIQPKEKKVITFEYKSKNVESSEFLAISNKQVDIKEEEVSIGEALAVPLYINASGGRVAGASSEKPNTLLEVIKFNIGSIYTLFPSNSYDIDIKNSGKTFVKPTFLLQVFSPDQGKSFEKKLNEFDIRMLPETRYTLKGEFNIQSNFKLSVLPQKYTVRLSALDFDGTYLIVREQNYYVIPIIQIIVLLLLVFGIFTLTRKNVRVGVKKLTHRKKEMHH